MAAPFDKTAVIFVLLSVALVFAHGAETGEADTDQDSYHSYESTMAQMNIAFGSHGNEGVAIQALAGMYDAMAPTFQALGNTVQQQTAQYNALPAEEKEQYNNAATYCRTSLLNWPPSDNVVVVKNAGGAFGGRDLTYGEFKAFPSTGNHQGLSGALQGSWDWKRKKECIESGEYARGVAYHRRSLVPDGHAGALKSTVCRGNSPSCTLDYEFTALSQTCKIRKNIQCSIYGAGTTKPPECEIQMANKQVVCCSHTLQGVSGTKEACEATALKFRL
jgi:hypothetical protein